MPNDGNSNTNVAERNIHSHKHTHTGPKRAANATECFTRTCVLVCLCVYARLYVFSPDAILTNIEEEPKQKQK